MKRLLSTALAVALLLGLGALAVLARGGGDILTPADNAGRGRRATADGCRAGRADGDIGYGLRSRCHLKQRRVRQR